MTHWTFPPPNPHTAGTDFVWMKVDQGHIPAFYLSFCTSQKLVLCVCDLFRLPVENPLYEEVKQDHPDHIPVLLARLQALDTEKVCLCFCV